ncbi:MAG: hypothetical protein ACMUIG_04515 [Thermoplasmatota archaeon]
MIASLILIPTLSGKPDNTSPDKPIGGSHPEISDNISINGDGGFFDYSFITGNGTENDPFIISRINMTTYDIRIENTTAYFTITDVEWEISSEYRMVFRNNSHITLYNITIESDLFIHGRNCTDLRILDCDFFYTADQEVVISFSDLISIMIKNTNLSNVPPAYRSKIELYSDSGITRISNSTFVGCDFKSFIDGTQIIENSIFLNARLFPKGMSNSSEIRNCQFENIYQWYDSGILLQRYTTYHNNGAIRNNTFRSCNVAIFIYGQTDDQAPRFKIIDNIIENSIVRGIYLESEKVDVINNTFSSNWNSIWARGSQNKIWFNRFIDSKVNHALDFSGGNSWDNGMAGNYWDDHVSPDVDGNGIVDIPYNVSAFTNDRYFDRFPITNINLDHVKPSLYYTSHSSGYINRSYNRIGWEAHDEWGIKKIEIRKNSDEWIDVTDRDIFNIFLEQGSYNFSLMATDNNGLNRTIYLDLQLNETVPVVTISDPSNLRFTNDDPITVNWTIVDYFTVSKLFF